MLKFTYPKQKFSKGLKDHLILPDSNYILGFITLQKMTQSYVQFVFLKRKIEILLFSPKEKTFLSQMIFQTGKKH